MLVIDDPGTPAHEHAEDCSACREVENVWRRNMPDLIETAMRGDFYDFAPVEQRVYAGRAVGVTVLALTTMIAGLGGSQLVIDAYADDGADPSASLASVSHAQSVVDALLAAAPAGSNGEALESFWAGDEPARRLTLHALARTLGLLLADLPAELAVAWWLVSAAAPYECVPDAHVAAGMAVLAVADRDDDAALVWHLANRLGRAPSLMVLWAAAIGRRMPPAGAQLMLVSEQGVTRPSSLSLDDPQRRPDALAAKMVHAIAQDSESEMNATARLFTREDITPVGMTLLSWVASTLCDLASP